MKDAWLGSPMDLESEYGTFSIRHFILDGLEGVTLERWIGAGRRPQGEHRQGSEPALVRLQSSCVFSEAFGADDCDCALQLETALRLIESRGGLVVYTYEEGRGAGLSMKIQAIRVQQEEGLNTAAAYRKLGLPEDSRSFTTHARVIEAVLGNKEIILLTNNPLKVEALRREGVKVIAREPLVVTPSPKIKEYLANKASALGHFIGPDEP